MLNALGKLFHPLYEAMAYLLAFWYGLIPNYAVAITLFTLTVMVVLAPLTVKSTRSMLAMQRLQPQVAQLKEKYKNDKMAMQQAQMDLFKSEGINPAGGCLPMFIQLPVFLVLYRVIQGLTKKVGVHHLVQPLYISHSSLLYKHLIAAHGNMVSFGVNLAKAATSAHSSFLVAIPFYLLLVVCIGLQFLQMRQLSSRAPKQTGTAAQTQAIMKFMPLIFGVIYLEIPAGVNVYFLISSLFRVGQQELMYRFDPQVRSHATAVKDAGNQRVERPVVKGNAADLSKDGPRSGGGLLSTLRTARADLVANASANAARSTTRGGLATPSNSPARSTNGAARSTNGAARSTNGAARSTKTGGPAKPSNSPARSTNGAARSTKTGGPAKPSNSPARSTNGAPRPKSGSTDAAPNPTKLVGEPNQKRRPAPAALAGAAETSSSRPAPKPEGDVNGTSWARRPREAAAVSANGVARDRNGQTISKRGPAAPGNESSGSEASKDGANSVPNRSRGKRPRRTR